MQTYHITHTAGRASLITADLDAVVQAVNRSIDASGIMDRRQVEREIDAHCPAELREYVTVHAVEASAD